MENIEVIIVDDEPRSRRVIKHLLAENFSDIKVVAECSGVIDAVEQIKQLAPQVVFLDIHMPTYAGYEIVNFFKKIDFHIIFVTASDQYAIKAFELCAIDYLMKPIDRDQLYTTIEKLKQVFDTNNRLTQYQILLDSIKENKPGKIVIPEIGNRRVLDLKNIIAVEASGAYTNIYTIQDNTITTSKNLKHFEDLLAHHDCFFRTHRGWIVNVDHIQTFNKTNRVLTLERNINARLSRNRVEAFEAMIS